MQNQVPQAEATDTAQQPENTVAAATTNTNPGAIPAGTVDNTIATPQVNNTPANNTAIANQNRGNRLARLFRTPNRDTQRTASEFSSAMLGIFYAIGIGYTISKLAKQNKSAEDKKLAPYFAAILATSNLIMLAVAVSKIKRYLANNRQNASDGNTVTLDRDQTDEIQLVRTRNTNRQNTDGGNTLPPGTDQAEEQQIRNRELANLGNVPQRTESGNSLNSSLSRFRSNDSTQNASRTRSRALSV